MYYQGNNDLRPLFHVITVQLQCLDFGLTTVVVVVVVVLLLLLLFLLLLLLVFLLLLF